MKITCQSCQAKYTIADEKVLGKVVKIRCKKCAATIVVNGNDPSAIASVTESVLPEAPRTPEGGEAPQDAWTVNVAEGDQRTMTDADVTAAFQAGAIDADTFFWKEGMDDWAALRDLAPLYAACTAAGTPGAAMPMSSRLGGSRAGANAGVGAASSNGTGVTFPLGAAATAAQSAARRGGGRAPAADLFGGVAQAGGEEDVLTSAPSKMPQAHDDPQKGPIGARNENSVLFSMSAVTSKGQSDRPAPPPSVSATSEASGLIDIRQLSAQLIVEDKKRSRVDDIMNLSGGGAFLPNLAAPSLSAPSVEEYAGAGTSQAPGGGRNKGLIFLALGAGAFLVVAAVGGATMLMHGKAGVAGEGTTSSATSSGEVATAPSGSGALVAPVASDTPTAASAASAASSASAASAAAEPSTQAKVAAPSNDVPREKPASAPIAAVAHEAAPRPAAVETDQPFNMGEAKAKLGAAASSASACKKASGPTGTGRVVVVFAPSGATQSAAVSGDPFEGTPTGACVASKFRAVRVPPFSGSPFSVSKSFTIN